MRSSLNNGNSVNRNKAQQNERLRVKFDCNDRRVAKKEEDAEGFLIQSHADAIVAMRNKDTDVKNAIAEIAEHSTTVYLQQSGGHYVFECLCSATLHYPTQRQLGETRVSLP